jgi:hypothetical protein
MENGRTLPVKGGAVDLSGSAALSGQEQCFAMCDGYLYASLQWGGDCWCGNTMTGHGSDPSAGDVEDERCALTSERHGSNTVGGRDAMAIYQRSRNPWNN